ncbi:MAG: hypothetical protein AAGA29_00650 [Planctomycetota bacterium]
MDNLSLLPKQYTSRAAVQRAKRLWTVAAAASALLAAGVIGWSGMQAGPVDQGRHADQVALAERRIEESKQEALVLGARLAQNRHALSAIDAVSGQPDWKALLDRISIELGDKVLLTDCRFGAIVDPAMRQAVGAEGHGGDSAWLVLGGLAESYQEVPALLLRLESIGLFKQVLLIDTRGESFGDQQRIGFRIACRAQ